jgi:hypothetical protein
MRACTQALFARMVSLSGKPSSTYAKVDHVWEVFQDIGVRLDAETIKYMVGGPASPSNGRPLHDKVAFSCLIHAMSSNISVQAASILEFLHSQNCALCASFQEKQRGIHALLQIILRHQALGML